MLCNSPDNTCHIAEYVNSEWERATSQGYDLFDNVVSFVIDLAAYGLIFCSALEIRTYYVLLKGGIEDVVERIEEEDVLN